MDGTRFDTLIKLLAITPVTRWDAVRGLAASATALAGLTLAAEPGTARKKGDEPKKKVCVCTESSCRTLTKPKDKVKKLLKNNPCASKGGCQPGVNPCAGALPSTCAAFSEACSTSSTGPQCCAGLNCDFLGTSGLRCCLGPRNACDPAAYRCCSHLRCAQPTSSFDFVCCAPAQAPCQFDGDCCAEALCNGGRCVPQL